MKTITLHFAAFFLMVNAVQAQFRSLTTTCNNAIEVDQPIAFNERGITFYVFTNGEFDFNTDPNTTTDILYRKGRRNYNDNPGVLIEQDSQGRIRRIGNVFLNYDYQNRVKRIGSVFMKYNRNLLTQIGGMRLIYDCNNNLVNQIGFITNHGVRYGYC